MHLIKQQKNLKKEQTYHECMNEKKKRDLFLKVK